MQANTQIDKLRAELNLQYPLQDTEGFLKLYQEYSKIYTKDRLLAFKNLVKLPY